MKAQAIPQAILDFLGQWLTSCIQALFSPGDFGRSETDTLPKLLGFAASSATVAFTLFSLVLPGWKVEQNINYLIFVVLLWCIICFIITAFIKICGGSQKPAANIAVCLHLSALFYLLEMVVAIAVFYMMKNSMGAFELAFIVTGSVLSLVYFPIILGPMNDLSFKRKTAFVSLCTPLVVGLAAFNLITSGFNPVMPPAAPPPAMSPAPKPPAMFHKPPPAPTMPQAPVAGTSDAVFNPPAAPPPAMTLSPPPAPIPPQAPPAGANNVVFNPPPVSAIQRPPPAILLQNIPALNIVQPKKPVENPHPFQLKPSAAQTTNLILHPPPAAMAP